MEHKRLYNRWKQLSDMGVFARMMDCVAAAVVVPTTVKVDLTYLKPHRLATSPRSDTGEPANRGAF